VDTVQNRAQTEMRKPRSGVHFTKDRFLKISAFYGFILLTRLLTICMMTSPTHGSGHCELDPAKRRT
jgi:hypothetical protein